jgi:hypothetical protein
MLNHAPALSPDELRKLLCPVLRETSYLPA